LPDVVAEKNLIFCEASERSGRSQVQSHLGHVYTLKEGASN
jgi:hypothetical protein